MFTLIVTYRSGFNATWPGLNPQQVIEELDDYIADHLRHGAVKEFKILPQ